MTPGRRVVCVLLFALCAGARMAAQATGVEVQTAAGLHTVLFRTTAGVVRVQVAADAAPGDTLSGVVLAESAGTLPDERARNLAQLNALRLVAAGTETSVAEGRYQWLVPAAIRTGRLPISLRAGGRTLTQVTVPIDGVPAPILNATGGPLELPLQGQAGQPAVVRGVFTGRLDQLTIRVGAVMSQALAASPRRVVFTVPGQEVGPIPLTVSGAGEPVQGTIRVLAVRLSASATQLTPGQTATLTGTVTGLRGVEAPTTVVLNNLSAEIVRVQDGDVQTVTIAPGDVSPSGTFAVTRRITVLQPGAFRITLLANTPPLTEFDPTAAAERILSSWEAATGVRITPATRMVIERSVMENTASLQQFLAQQQRSRGDVRDIFAALLSHYCFDLRDSQTPRPLAQDRPSPFRLVALAQPRGNQREITAGDVQRLSFGEFLNTLLARFSGAQPVGYLFISSVPASGGITIDGQRKNEMTNRRFVTSTGEHAIVVAAPSRTCRERVQVGAYQTAVVTCGG